MILSCVKLERTVTFIKYIASVDSSVKWTVLAHFGFQPRGQNFQTQI